MLSIPITTTAHALCQTLSVYVPHLQAASNMKKQLALIQVQAPDRHMLTQGSAAPERDVVAFPLTHSYHLKEVFWVYLEGQRHCSFVTQHELL